MSVPLLLVLTTLIAVGVYTYFFYAPTDATPNADWLGTAAKSNRVFHELLTNDATLRTDFPADGVLLCFEKIPRGRMRQRHGEPVSYSPAEQCRLFGIDPSLAVLTERGLAESARALARQTLDDPKPLMLTHWFEMATGTVQTRYNVYASLDKHHYDLPTAAIAQYGQIATLVRDALQTGQYTHLLIASTGWNNQPTASVGSYKEWLSHLHQSAQADGQAFTPFFIGITWSSFWETPALSVFNKANDADELGMTHLNYLLWKELLPMLRTVRHPLPVVVVGHSFGARLLSRMTHSRFMLDDVDLTTAIDLEIDWQGAYPVSRFFDPTTNNGGLYTIDTPVVRHIVTSSPGDKAVNLALHSDYVGNDTSVEVVKRSVATSDRYGIGEANATGLPAPVSAQPAVVFVPCGSFIANHNDVHGAEAGRFMWEWIKQIDQ